MHTCLFVSFCEKTIFIYILFGLKITTSHALNQTFCVPWCELGSKLFEWSKISMTSQDYQLSFCPGRCTGSQFVIIEEYVKCANLNCFPCDCNKPLCHLFGTCCPDIIEPTTENLISLTPSELEPCSISSDNIDSTLEDSLRHEILKTSVASKEETIQPKCGVINLDHFLYIRSCPPDFSPNSEEKMRCENDIPVREMDAMTYIHVTDITTGAVYFNEYCARCNKVSKFTRWDVSIACENFHKVYQAEYDEGLLKQSLQTVSLCNVSLVVSDNAIECVTDWFDDVVHTCNATGLWVLYDEDVVEACAKHSLISDRMCSKDNCYKNIFCAVCNMDSYPGTPHNCKPMDPATCEQTNACAQTMGPSGVYKLLPFSLLIDFGSNQHQTEQVAELSQNCSSNTEWTSPDGKCLPLDCSPGKILMNGECSTVAQELENGLSLLYVPLVLHESSPDSDVTTLSNDELYPQTAVDYLYKFVDTIIGYNMSFINEDVVKFVLAFQVGQSPKIITRKEQFKWFALERVTNASNGQNRDEFDNFLINDLVPKEFKVQINPTSTLTFTPIIVQYNQKYIFDYFYLKNEGIAFVDVCTTVSNIINNGSRDPLFACTTTISFDLACAFVIFGKTNYTLQVNENIVSPTRIVTLNFTTTTFIFDDPNEFDYLSMDEQENLKVCQEILNKKLSQFKAAQLKMFGTLFQVQQILTIFCISVSVFCLLLTLITYILFVELRNEAGENNIFLCSNLGLAQLSLLIASQITDNGYFCTIFGIGIHFFWLNTFCWSFTCSFHMFRTFTAKTRSVRSTRSKKNLVLKLGFSVSLPVVVVTAVVVGNVLTTEGKRIGYGDTRCSLDSVFVISGTVIAPIVAILVCNIVFFLITVIQIHSVRKLQTPEMMSKRDSSQSIYIYCKLSTVTGAFWAVVIVSEATNTDSMRIIAIILNGLQGVFIFVSFICNKRVFILYKRKGYPFFPCNFSTSTNCSDNSVDNRRPPS